MDGKTKQYSFPCVSEDFYQPGPLHRNEIKVKVDDTEGDPTRPVTEDDESVVLACEKVMAGLATGDTTLYLSASWTAPYVLKVTGEPYSHGGLVVIDDYTIPGTKVALVYEATNNKSGTPDFMGGMHSTPHIFPKYEGLWGFEFTRRMLSYTGNCVLAPLRDPTRSPSQHAAVAQFAKHCHVYSSAYDKMQFGAATLKALTDKIDGSKFSGMDVDQDDLSAFFCVSTPRTHTQYTIHNTQAIPTHHLISRVFI